jgi:hypothetical protein
MAKGKRGGKGGRKKRDKPDKAPPAPPPPRPPLVVYGAPQPPEPSRPWWRKTSAGVYGFLALVGLLISLAALVPALSGSADDPLFPSDPLSAPFHVRNEWLLPLRHLVAVCVLNEVTFAGGLIADDKIGNPVNSREWLSPRDDMAVSCWVHGWDAPNFAVDRITSARITIRVSYMPPLLPFHRTKFLTFRTVMDQAQRFHWLPDTVSH